MSSKAIDRRLREVGQLYRLGISLGKAKPIEDKGATSAVPGPPRGGETGT